MWAARTRRRQIQNDKLPDTKVVTVGRFRIGLCHGHQLLPWADVEVCTRARKTVAHTPPAQALAMQRRMLDVDVMVTGHTHKFEAFEHDGYFYINPGSITGAFSPLDR
jgi:vacuolar protein sorting-associated protein 29